MSDWRNSMEEAKRLFFLSVGISNSAGRRLSPKLGDVVAGVGWRVENCLPAIVDHEGRWALRLDPLPGDGTAWLLGHRFSTGKVDFRVAAVEQQVGIVLQPLSGGARDLFGCRFLMPANAATGEIELRLWLETGGERHEASHFIPLKMRGEWIPIRIVVTHETLSLFVARDHVPIIKVAHGHSTERPADFGIWRGSDAMALVADLKLIATDEWGLR